jgi:hypothetical protein
MALLLILASLPEGLQALLPAKCGQPVYSPSLHQSAQAVEPVADRIFVTAFTQVSVACRFAGTYRKKRATRRAAGKSPATTRAPCKTGSISARHRHVAQGRCGLVGKETSMVLRQLPAAMTLTLVLLAGCCHSHARPCPAPGPACCTPGAGPLVPAAPVPAAPPPGAVTAPPPGAVITPPPPNFGR